MIRNLVPLISSLLEDEYVVNLEKDAQSLTVAVSSNETSDKSTDDLVLFPLLSACDLNIKYTLRGHRSVLSA